MKETITTDTVKPFGMNFLQDINVESPDLLMTATIKADRIDEEDSIYNEIGE